jgi:signal peptidase II
MDWFRIHFIENPGMAWGWKFGNETGKLILTLFRLIAVIIGTWYLSKMTKQNFSRGLMICAGLIYAGALGNLIDSMFYGMFFDKGLHFDSTIGDYVSYIGRAAIGSEGYSSFLHGSVVDMLYFPIINTTWPAWVPVIGGQEFEFFSPIFNIADAAITGGVIMILLFQKRYFKEDVEVETTPVNELIPEPAQGPSSPHVSTRLTEDSEPYDSQPTHASDDDNSSKDQH